MAALMACGCELTHLCCDSFALLTGGAAAVADNHSEAKQVKHLSAVPTTP